MGLAVAPSSRHGFRVQFVTRLCARIEGDGHEPGISLRLPNALVDLYVPVYQYLLAFRFVLVSRNGQVSPHGQVCPTDRSLPIARAYRYVRDEQVFRFDRHPLAEAVCRLCRLLVVCHHDPTLVGLNCLNEQGEEHLPCEVVFQAGQKIHVGRNLLDVVAETVVRNDSHLRRELFFPVGRRVQPFLAAFPVPIDLD